ncbi:MAG: hypothetical protein CBD16_05680 [Betaproteobacteria bacterium TMED156]|nr:MAG: hypothetical protein CBD16_05680 [Betaproteobacteria bacterium TMED156]|tara:strand:+ start:383 stop:589 length:207 start_codon:yes stop_codon:yes gene_type:complete
MVITFSFTTRLKTIAIFSLFLIFSGLILLGYELGRRATISDFQKQQTNVSANPVSTDTNKNSTEGSRR